jgi:hypothetical protein
MDGPGPAIGRIERGEEQAMGEPKASAGARAATVGIADFSEQLSSGVLRALDGHVRQSQGGAGKTYKPWIWAGIWIGIGPNDPSGGGPLGPGGTPL